MNNDDIPYQYSGFVCKRLMFILFIPIVVVCGSCLNAKEALVINEYMYDNTKTLSDEELSFPAWIELYNASGKPHNLKGFRLECPDTIGASWTFPDVTIRGREYLIVFLSGKARIVRNKKSKTTYVHTGFTVKGPETILRLSAPEGPAFDEIIVTDSEKDVSYERVGDGDGTRWSACEVPTPGFENSTAGYEQFIRKKEKFRPSVTISEVMASNRTTLIDDRGEFSDWIELHNSSDHYIYLKNYGLSDDIDSLSKWRFGDVALLPGQYLVVFASGAAGETGDRTFLHTNFKLNAGKESLFLSDPNGFIVDRISIKDLSDDMSCGRDETGWPGVSVYTAPTPGGKNSPGPLDGGETGNATGCYGLYISEVIPSGCDDKKDEDGEVSDIIEIHNKNSFSVNLRGYFLSDNPQHPNKWAFPEVMLQPDMYLFVFASGKNRHDRYLHTGFKLGSDEDELLFVHETAGIIDSIPILPGSFNMSYGRSTNDRKLVFFLNPTPGRPNSDGYSEVTGEVEFSLKGGFYSGPQHVAISGPPDHIYYTLDGSVPGRSSHRYTSPLLIDTTTILRARGFSEGCAPGKTATASFFFGTGHDLPVLSLVTDPSNLWDTRTGLLVKEHLGKRWERPVHIEFFETDGKTGFNLEAGMRLFGHSSRYLPQTPFYLLTRKRYGERTIRYRLFPDKDIRIFKSILLRNGGEDGVNSRIRDAVTSTLVRELGIDAQASRPVVLYINGGYWGQYFIRDKIDEYFLAYHHDIGNPSGIDLVEGRNRVIAGNADAYQSLFSYVASHNVRQRDVCDYIGSRIDFDNLITYEIAQIYFANTDMGNIRFWRERAPWGKWRWILFDTDWTFYVYERDSFSRNFDPAGRGYKNFFPTLFITTLLTNDGFTQRFKKRFNRLMKTTFSRDHVCSVIEAKAGAIESEMPAHCRRWNMSIDEWRKHVEYLKKFAAERPSYVYEHFRDYFNMTQKEFDDLSG
ncbi:MAG: CotH kinase family protein [Spirochaetales bacterium]|nr:CotH kinase family protein [Spirochaetales bacterium]